MDANADDPGGRAASSNPNGRAENVPVRDGENRGAATQQSQPHFAKISRRWAPVLSKLRPMDGPACERLEAVAFESPLHRQSTEKVSLPMLIIPFMYSKWRRNRPKYPEYMR